MSCPFCELITGEERELVYSSDKFVGFYDNYPVNEGHTLLVPREHLTSLASLSPALGGKLLEGLQEIRRRLTEKYSPDGFNYGVNDGRAAGQSIEHLHWHIIPRYTGDIPEPLGGVRGVIPDRRQYNTEGRSESSSS